MDQIVDHALLSRPVERWSDCAAFQTLGGRVHIGSILVMKVDHIGDFILSFDALIALRQAFPDARIDLVCAPWNEKLAHSLDLFDQIFTLAFFDKRADGAHPGYHPDMAASLPTGRYDLAIDLRVDHDTRVLLRHVSAAHKIGFESYTESDILTVALAQHSSNRHNSNVGIHQTMLMVRLVRTAEDLFKQTNDVKALILDRLAEPSNFDLSVAQERILVVCNTSSGRAVKNWPLDRFKRLIRWMSNDLDAVVLLIGGPDQQEETNEIIQFCGSSNVISAVAKTSVRQAVDLVAKASLFIGNDSGLTHVAARLGIPTVVLFSGIDPIIVWAARGENVTILRAPVACSPCHILSIEECRGEHACMLNLSEGAVRSAVRARMLTALRFGQPTSPVEQDFRHTMAFRNWASSDTQQVPQRYSDNHDRYLAGGGKLQVKELLQGFVANNRGNRGDINRFYTLALIFDQIVKEQLAGDIAELGVYKGNTACMLASLARQIGATAYLLDTFEGFDPADLSGVDANKQMEFADTSLEQVAALVGTSHVQFVKGFFPGTADQIPPDARFSLVHIDCDLYAPFKAALEFFYDRMVPGGFLIMHDYSSLHWDGAERAVDEFFSDKPESVMPVPDGSGTVVVRKAKPVDRFANWFVQGKTTGFAHAWVHANLPSVNDFLASGWSQPESWGVWGVGASHILSLYMTQEPRDGVELSAETTAVLLPTRPRQSVDVLVGGEVIDVWHFEMEDKTAVRQVVIPQDRIRLRNDLPILDVEFRPHSVKTPHELDPSIPDERPLGLGLMRFRLRHL